MLPAVKQNIDNSKYDPILDSITEGVFTVDENWKKQPSTGPQNRSQASHVNGPSEIPAKIYFGQIFVKAAALWLKP
jgi:hypothetical protein